ncbi:unnamed protein product [Bubo scandiacus]
MLSAASLPPPALGLKESRGRLVLESQLLPRRTWHPARSTAALPQDGTAKPREPSGWALEENKGTLSREANGMLQADDM